MSPCDKSPLLKRQQRIIIVFRAIITLLIAYQHITHPFDIKTNETTPSSSSSSTPTSPTSLPHSELIADSHPPSPTTQNTSPPYPKPKSSKPQPLFTTKKQKISHPTSKYTSLILNTLINNRKIPYLFSTSYTKTQKIVNQKHLYLKYSLYFCNGF